MSTKTYAGFRHLPSTAQQRTTATGGDMVLISPFDGRDDNFYTSRLGFPNCGDGAWFVAKRVSDGKSSTDDYYNTSVYYYSGIIAFDVCDYDHSYHVQFSTSGSTSFRRIRISTDVRIIRNVRRVQDLQCLADVYQQDIRRENVYERELPFTWKRLQDIANSRDFEAAYSWCMRICQSPYSPGWGTVSNFIDQWNIDTKRTADRVYTVDLTPSRSVFLDVLDKCQWYLETGILPGPWAMGLETAYIEASNSLPQSATNVAANVLECAETLAALFSGNFGKLVPKNPKEAWLAYRYAYTTTKLDVQETKSIFNRLGDLSLLSKAEVYGSYTRGGIEFRVGYEVDVAQILPSDVSSTMRRFGLELNALNVWDMIPYSFIVDWFLPISDLIQYFSELDACRLIPEDMWFSITTVIDGHNVYARLPGRKLSTMPYLSLRSASTRTVCMRIADSLALFSP